MVIEYIRYRIPPDDVETFVQAYERAALSLDAAPNCLGYELARCVEEPDRFILRIHWDSVEGHMSGFRGSEPFREFFSHVRPYVDAIEEMQHYEATPVASSGFAS